MLLITYWTGLSLRFTTSADRSSAFWVPGVRAFLCNLLLHVAPSTDSEVLKSCIVAVTFWWPDSPVVLEYLKEITWKKKTKKKNVSQIFGSNGILLFFLISLYNFKPNRLYDLRFLFPFITIFAMFFVFFSLSLEGLFNLLDSIEGRLHGEQSHVYRDSSIDGRQLNRIIRYILPVFLQTLQSYLPLSKWKAM